MESTEYVTLNLRVPKGGLEFVKHLIQAGGVYHTPEEYFEQAILTDIHATIDDLGGRDFFDREAVSKKFGIPTHIENNHEGVKTLG
jgi:hypothetical protein